MPTAVVAEKDAIINLKKSFQNLDLRSFSFIYTCPSPFHLRLVQRELLLSFLQLGNVLKCAVAAVAFEWGGETTTLLSLISFGKAIEGKEWW